MKNFLCEYDIEVFMKTNGHTNSNTVDVTNKTTTKAFIQITNITE